MFLQIRMLLSDRFPTEARFMWSTAFNQNILSSDPDSKKIWYSRQPVACPVAALLGTLETKDKNVQKDVTSSVVYEISC